MPKANDTCSQMILEYNLKYCVGEVSIKQAINSWKEDINSSNEGLGVVYETEEEMVQGLYQILQDEWNDDNERAKHFLQENCTLEIVRCIEDLYVYWELEFGGWVGGKDTLEEKLDLVYYFEAEELLKKAIEEEELDMDYWS